MFPVVIDGKKQWIDGVTVTEVPTKIKGVINTFLPKKLKRFQYSFNFGPWTDIVNAEKGISNVDEWGNFEIDGLKFAEGQNVLAFRGKNKVGYESHQILKVVLNTIKEQCLALKSISPFPQMA